MINHHYRVSVVIPVIRNRKGELQREYLKNGTLSFATLEQAERFCDMVKEPMQTRLSLRLKVWGQGRSNLIDIDPADLGSLLEQLNEINHAIQEETDRPREA